MVEERELQRLNGVVSELYSSEEIKGLSRHTQEILQELVSMTKIYLENTSASQHSLVGSDKNPLSDTALIKISMEECFNRAVERFDFSDRESEILKLISDGCSNSEISDRLHVSISTVKKHVYNIFNKGGVNSRTQLLNLVYSLA
ncbi:MAG: helix-turn-helix transcriptional regulator [Treponema sp.]|nr:helix-turn-helix transcriptional regulator [Candidatus Treponema equifaecale]